MPQVGFDTKISAGEWPQTYSLDRAATGTGKVFYYNTIMFYKFHMTVVLFPAESKMFLLFKRSRPPLGPTRLTFNGTERLCVKLTTIDLNLMPKLRMIGSMEYLCYSCFRLYFCNAFNHLTPELNPSAQRCLKRRFTVDFASWTVHFVNICVKNQQMQQLLVY
jgi:hypothetical protein